MAVYIRATTKIIIVLTYAPKNKIFLFTLNKFDHNDLLSTITTLIDRTEDFFKSTHYLPFCIKKCNINYINKSDCFREKL
jgi:hypothetical protein